MYNIMLFTINKNQSGYFSPADFNRIIQQAQYSYLDFLLGSFQKFPISKPLPPVEFGMTQTIRQRLSPLIGPLVTLTVDGAGFCAYPANYQQTDAMFTTDMNRVKYVQQDSLYKFLQSVIDPVDTNPIFLIEDNGFRFYPNNIGNALLSYVATPPDIIWGYILDGNGRPIYDQGSSSDPVWQDTDCLQIIVRGLRMVGVNLQFGELSQYAETVKNIGQ